MRLLLHWRGEVLFSLRIATGRALLRLALIVVPAVLLLASLLALSERERVSEVEFLAAEWHSELRTTRRLRADIADRSLLLAVAVVGSDLPLERINSSTKGEGRVYYDYLALLALEESRDWFRFFDGVMRHIPHTSPLPDEPYITSPYGMRWHPLRPGRHLHSGTDFRAAVGTPVFAAADGTVIALREEERQGYGLMVRLVHLSGYETRYAHLSSIGVEANQHVRAGEKIGRSGATGSVTAAHLHYEVRRGKQPIDPRPFLPW